MMELKKHCCVLMLTFVVVFLFGCQEEAGQGPAVDAASKKPLETKAVEQTYQLQDAEAAKEVRQSDEVQENPEAKQRLSFAQNNLKMAQKGILNYSQIVALCRGIISDYPNTDYEQQAQMLLREIPKDLRPQYNLSNEELGL